MLRRIFRYRFYARQRGFELRDFFVMPLLAYRYVVRYYVYMASLF